MRIYCRRTRALVVEAKGHEEEAIAGRAPIGTGAQAPQVGWRLSKNAPMPSTESASARLSIIASEATA